MAKYGISRNLHKPRRKIRDGDLNQALAAVEVSEENQIRSLHLGSETIQSSMDLDAPERLVLSYSRAMMAWLMLHDQPRRIVQIGLGGGSFARWIAHYLPETVSIAVDIHPQVIAVARSLFALPPETDLFRIAQDDGAAYIRTEKGTCDAILVDAFDGYEIIQSLTETPFFEDCLQALAPEGVMVANWWSADPHYLTYLENLLAVFSGRVLEIPASTHGNVAVMAFRNTPDECRLTQLATRIPSLKARFGLEFDQFFQSLTKDNLCANGKLLL